MGVRARARVGVRVRGWSMRSHSLAAVRKGRTVTKTHLVRGVGEGCREV